jgi:hypothetical protein
LAARVRAADRFELFVAAPEPAGDAAVVLASFRSARLLAPLPRRGGAAGERWRRIISGHERILAAFGGRATARPLPRGRELRELGRDLFDTLLPGEIRRLYDTARSRRGGGPLDLVFTSMLDWVADKPWELAFDEQRQEFLATSAVNFVRNAYTAVPADSVARRRGRLRVLVVAPRPRGLEPLGGELEVRGLERAFQPLAAAGRAQVERLPRATAAALQRRLAKGGVDVLHYVGHGEHDPVGREGLLLLEDERGEPSPLGAEPLRQLLCGRGLSLVFLNACESGRGGRSDWIRGAAPALVAGGVPAVVANQYAVLDSAATLFARELYHELAGGRAIGDAAREARVAVAREHGTARFDWAVPVVFARDPREPLR